jgi:hypothetical protein
VVGHFHLSWVFTASQNSKFSGREAGKETVKITKHAILRTRLALITTGIFLLCDFILGIYHFTHGGGWVSGSLELFFGCVIGGLVYRVFRTRKRKDLLNRYRTAFIASTGAIALTLLVLSIYHFSHQGLPSGIIELLLAGVLAASGWLIISPQ